MTSFSSYFFFLLLLKVMIRAVAIATKTAIQSEVFMKSTPNIDLQTNTLQLMKSFKILMLNSEYFGG
ncbi:hypothetical protein J6TS1_37000 [Siminovitchia terrae]|uniref:Secreted protein n=1 Tax=Siminovitchia terrae TaxID=1914933 RepID=A0ABQ4L1U8_SIMTE|nr:hypothetical protein J6TS1_37000 [Siminovitchia terrae]